MTIYILPYGLSLIAITAQSRGKTAIGVASFVLSILARITWLYIGPRPSTTAIESVGFLGFARMYGLYVFVAIQQRRSAS